MFRAYKFVRLTEFSDRTLPSPASSTLSISSHPPSSQPGNSPHSRLSWLLSPSCALHTPQRDTSGRGRDTPHNIHPHDQPVPLTLEVDYPTTADASTPADLADQLQLPLPPNCRRLGQEDLKIVGTRPIDAGGFADVWVGEMDGRAVAVKSYRCYASANCTPTYKRFYHEASVYSRLSSKHILSFVGVYSAQEHPFALVFEFMEHLNLREYLRNNSEVGRLELLLEIARAVSDIHGVNVVHGNIKITNILVNAGGHTRIAGLGAASIPPNLLWVDVDRFFHGAAPELIDPQRFGIIGTEVTKASDIYAFGVIAWEVFAGRVPFPDMNRVAGVYSMLEGRRPSRPSHPELSDRLWKLIKGCWKDDPAQRTTIAEVVGILEAEMDSAKQHVRAID